MSVLKLQHIYKNLSLNTRIQRHNIAHRCYESNVMHKLIRFHHNIVTLSYYSCSLYNLFRCDIKASKNSYLQFYIYKFLGAVWLRQEITMEWFSTFWTFIYFTSENKCMCQGSIDVVRVFYFGKVFRTS